MLKRLSVIFLVVSSLAVASAMAAMPASAASLSSGEGSGPNWCSAYGGTNLTSFDNVYACGLTKSSPSGAGATPFDPKYAGFQCAELAARFVWDEFGVAGKGGTPVAADGYNFASTVHTDDPSVPLVPNGTVGQPYLAGDIVSFNGVISKGVNLEPDGHVAMVTVSTENSAGNGAVTIMEQNSAAADGHETLTVSNWSLQKANGSYVTPSNFDAFESSTRSPAPTSGKAGLLYQEPGSANISLLTSGGTTISGANTWASGVGDPVWEVAGDFTGDGKADLLYQEPGSANISLLTSGGTTISGANTWASGVGDPVWEKAT
jgi:hypothetical protein